MTPNGLLKFDEIENIVTRLSYQYFWNDVEKYEMARSHPVTWLVAAAPFLAGDPHAIRWSATNLGTLMNAKNNPGFFVADESDTLETRIAPIVQLGIEDETDAFKRVKLLLQYILLKSYEFDADDDKRTNRFNPIVAGTLDPAESEDAILKALDALPLSEETDSILTTNDVKNYEPGTTPYSFWYN